MEAGDCYSYGVGDESRRRAEFLNFGRLTEQENES